MKVYSLLWVAGLAVVNAEQVEVQQQVNPPVVAAAPPPPPPPCDCEPHVAQCESKCHIAMKTAETEHSRKYQESLAAAQDQSAKELQTWRDNVAQLQKSLSESQSTIKALQSNRSDAEVKLQTRLDDQKAEYEAQARKEREVRATEVASLRKTLEEVKAKHQEAETLAKSLRNDLSKSKEQMSHLQLKIHNFENVIFSQSHLEVMSHNLRAIADALLDNFKHNINRLFNADVFELIRLQSLVVYSKLEPQVEQAKALSAALADRLDVVERYLEVQRAALPYVDRGLSVIENKMERLILTLSRADPKISQMFPESFGDRVVAFTYLGVIGYVVSSIISAVWSVVSYPFQGLVSKAPKKANAVHQTAKKVAVKTPMTTVGTTTKVSKRRSSADRDGNSVAETDVNTTPR